MSFYGYNPSMGASTGGSAMARSPATAQYAFGSRRSQTLPANFGSMERKEESSTSANYNPFVTSQQGHPQFQPVKLGVKATESKVTKPPKPPEKPLMPYMRFHRKCLKKVWDEVKRTQPDAKLWEVGKVIGQKWRELPDDQKAELNAEYEAEKAAYNEALKQYHNSPAYQAYLVAKSRQEQGQTEESIETPSKAKIAKLSETDISIQPAEDEDDPDDGFSVKHVAAARFHRNQRLLAEVFSEVGVPDVRSVVTSQRISTLRKQVHSLQVHQKKLEDELETLEEKHEGKKQQIKSSMLAFDEQATKLLQEKPVIDEETYAKIYDDAYNQLQEEAAKAPAEPPVQLQDPSPAQSLASDKPALTDGGSSLEADSVPSLAPDSEINGSFTSTTMSSTSMPYGGNQPHTQLPTSNSSCTQPLPPPMHPTDSSTATRSFVMADSQPMPHSRMPNAVTSQQPLPASHLQQSSIYPPLSTAPQSAADSSISQETESVSLPGSQQRPSTQAFSQPTTPQSSGFQSAPQQSQVMPQQMSSSQAQLAADAPTEAPVSSMQITKFVPDSASGYTPQATSQNVPIQVFQTSARSLNSSNVPLVQPIVAASTPISQPLPLSSNSLVLQTTPLQHSAELSGQQPPHVAQSSTISTQENSETASRSGPSVPQQMTQNTSEPVESAAAVEGATSDGFPMVSTQSFAATAVSSTSLNAEGNFAPALSHSIIQSSLQSTISPYEAYPAGMQQTSLPPHATPQIQMPQNTNQQAKGLHVSGQQAVLSSVPSQQAVLSSVPSQQAVLSSVPSQQASTLPVSSQISMLEQGNQPTTLLNQQANASLTSQQANVQPNQLFNTPQAMNQNNIDQQSQSFAHAPMLNQTSVSNASNLQLQGSTGTGTFKEVTPSMNSLSASQSESFAQSASTISSTSKSTSAQGFQTAESRPSLDPSSAPVQDIHAAPVSAPENLEASSVQSQMQRQPGAFVNPVTGNPTNMANYHIDAPGSSSFASNLTNVSLAGNQSVKSSFSSSEWSSQAIRNQASAMLGNTSDPQPAASTPPYQQLNAAGITEPTQTPQSDESNTKQS